MMKHLGEVLVLEDGSEAPIVPLKDDRGALGSLVLSTAVACAPIAYTVLFG